MKRRRYRASKEDRQFEDFMVVLFVIVLLGGFALFFTWNFITNCIFEWPIRWDVAQCFDDQLDPSWKKAGENAMDFLPRGKK